MLTDSSQQDSVILFNTGKLSPLWINYGLEMATIN